MSYYYALLCRFSRVLLIKQPENKGVARNFYTEAGNKDCAQSAHEFLATPPLGVKPRPFWGVYHNRSNLDCLLEAGMVRKAVLSRS